MNECCSHDAMSHSLRLEMTARIWRRLRNCFYQLQTTLTLKLQRPSFQAAMYSAFLDTFRRRQIHYQQGPKIYAERGTTYPCAQAAIDELQDTQLRPRTEPDTHMSMGEATRRLENAHRPGNPLDAGQKAALQRLQDLEKVGKYGPDIVFKIFNDLDTLLFHGALNGNVYLRWSSTDELIRQNGYGKASGRMSEPGFIAKRVGIQLNKDILQLSTTRLRDAIATLVHECIVSHPWPILLCIWPEWS